MENMKQDLLSMSKEELQGFCKEMGLPAFRGKQIFKWLQAGVTDFDGMSNISKKDQEKLAECSYITAPKIIKEQISRDKQTAKLLLDFGDDVLIEVVLMFYRRKESRNRQTICISTQAGCGMACKFCATGLGGLTRNLTAGEIISQVITGNKWLADNDLGGLSNVVYMGMGEPFGNYKNTVKSLRMLNDVDGLNIGQRRITISTCGLAPAIKTFANEGMEVGLAVSLHAPNDRLRSSLMPVNDSFPIEALMAACDYFTETTGRRISYEYALFQGVNDGLTQATELSKLMRGRLSHVNVIPANEVTETGMMPSCTNNVKEFMEAMADLKVEATLRERRGIDIDGACGQLRKRVVDGGR